MASGRPDLYAALENAGTIANKSSGLAKGNVGVFVGGECGFDGHSVSKHALGLWHCACVYPSLLACLGLQSVQPQRSLRRRPLHPTQTDCPTRS